MNMLNSLLLEGKVSTKPVLVTANSGKQVWQFELAHTYTKYNEKLNFIVQSTHENASILEVGNGVRVVARLQFCNELQKVIAVAEHIEIRPEPKKYD